MNVMVQNGEVITIVTVGEGFSQEVNIANEDGMANITVDTVPIEFLDCDECDCLANCEGCCDLCGVEDEDNEDNIVKKEIKPKELLKDGMFILERDVWYVVVGDNLVGEGGGHDLIEDYDENLCWRENVSFSIDAIVEADSFDSARDNYKEGLILWKRR